MKEWSIFNADDGFGGNGPYEDLPVNGTFFPIPGRTGGGCVPDGPFTSDKFLVGIGPAHNASISNRHCLRRDFSPEVVVYNLQPATWDEVLSQPDYGHFSKRLEAGK
jgi:tyrosinase